ncbi:myotubularin-related protein 6-like [Notothenia coriiceps]|nr:PREDICTED: myotubularin-related protein 6-like [Notothenia coriiceps]
MSERENYLNPFYSPAYSKAHPVLQPSTLPYHFKFWRNMYHQFDRSMHPRQSILKTVLNLREEGRKAESALQALENRLLQLGVTPVVTSDPPAPPPTRDQHCNTLPARPDSLILGAPINHKEVERQEEEFDQEEVGEEATESTDTERSVEGSSGTDSRKQSYGELDGTYSSELAKEEPAAVSLEFGVARMTC